MFVDEVKVLARAGHGGRGCVAFLREAFRPKGGPIGGDGGRGGDVILRADHSLNNLVNQYHAPRLIAENGGHGLGKGKNGRAGRALEVKVPCGTMVWRIVPRETALSETTEGPADRSPDTPPADTLPAAIPDQTPRSSGGRGAAAFEILLEETPPPRPGRTWRRGELVADLTEDGQEIVLCQGGRGGYGNRHFATARRQAPRFAQPGEPGEEGEFLLELRTIADVGLVGYPNAGKSTLLSALSRARPKIAPYPFTTLHPHVGVIEYPDWFRLTLCDVPGLVEGAHQNIGLGHEFLRHVRRCRVLAIVLDMAGADGRKPWEDYRQLLGEIEAYDASLLERPRLVIANKMDEATAPKNLRSFKRRVPRTPVIDMSAALEEGLEPFRVAMRALAEAAAAD